MHLDEEQVQHHLHGELAPAFARSASEHLLTCAECSRRVAALRQEEEEMTTLLRSLDGPMPDIDVGTIAARATVRGRESNSRSMLRRAAAILIALGLAGAAYAIPGSPVRAWVAEKLGWVAAAPEPRAARAPLDSPAQDGPATAGVALDPGRDLVIIFRTSQPDGHATVSLSDGPEVAVRAPNGAATFTTGEARLVIEVQGPSARFEIQVPRNAPRVEIQLNGDRIFLKQGFTVLGGHVTTGGFYLLPLAP